MCVTFCRSFFAAIRPKSTVLVASVSVNALLAGARTVSLLGLATTRSSHDLLRRFLSSERLYQDPGRLIATRHGHHNLHYASRGGLMDENAVAYGLRSMQPSRCYQCFCIQRGKLQDLATSCSQAAELVLLECRLSWLEPRGTENT